MCEGVEVHVCERVSRRMCVRGVEAYVCEGCGGA